MNDARVELPPREGGLNIRRDMNDGQMLLTLPPREGGLHIRSGT